MSTDTLANEQDTQFKNVVSYVSGVPVIELTSDEISYPLRIAERGKEYIVYCYLKAHTDLQSKSGFAYANKQTLRNALPEMRMEGDEVEFPEENVKAYEKFVDQHFLRFSGVKESEPEKHRRYLDERPHLKLRIFKEGVQGVELAQDYAQEDVDDLLDLTFDKTENVVPLVKDLYSPSTDSVEKIRMVHRLRAESQADFHKFKKASTRRMNVRKRTLTTVENYDVLEELYNAMVSSVQGFTVGDKACTSDNKKDWVTLIPLEDKLLVLETIFREVQVKNV